MFDPSKLSAIQWGIVPIIIFLRYLLIAGGAFMVFYVWRKRTFLSRKIQQRFPQTTDYWRELGYSALTSLIFGMVAWLCLGTPLRQYTQFYSDIRQHSLAWFFISIPLAIVLHDTYFYWAHRLMHHPKLYRRTHLTHHLSVNPSPWAAFAFHPLEALVEAAILPVLLFIMPLHPVAFFVFILFMTLFNVYGHLGYELFPKKAYRHPLGKWLNTSVYHNLHHEKFHGNYGLYFTFWDRMCGTLRADSADRLTQVHAQIEAEKTTETNPPKPTGYNISQA
jgi:Delta7-sterol 5-desaturase